MKKHVLMALLACCGILTVGFSGKIVENTVSASVTKEAVNKTSAEGESESETEAAADDAVTEETVSVTEAAADAAGDDVSEESAKEDATETVTEDVVAGDAPQEDAAEPETQEEAAGTEAQEDAAGTQNQTAESETEAELGERPDYTAKDYVTLGTYKGLSVVLEPLSVSDDEVELSIREDDAYAALAEVITSGAVEVGDVANIDYEGKLDGVAFEGGTAQGYDLEIGSHSFIDGFEDGLIGVGIGDTVDLNLTFPETYGNTDLAGQETVFTVTVNSVSRKPELTDAVASTLSDGKYTTLADYNEYVREQLLEEKEANQENEIYSDLMSQLYNTCTVNEYPQELLDYSVASMTRNYKDIAEAYGMEFTDFLNSYFGMDEDTFTAAVEDVVKQNLNYELILKAIAEEEEITLSEEEYKAGCERYVETYRDQYGYETAEDLEEANGREMIERSLLLDKVLDFVKDNALIEVLEPETETEPETLVGDIAEAASEPDLSDTEAAKEAAAEETITEAVEEGSEPAENESEDIAETFAEAETE